MHSLSPETPDACVHVTVFDALPIWLKVLLLTVQVLKPSTLAGAVPPDKTKKRIPVPPRYTIVLDGQIGSCLIVG